MNVQELKEWSGGDTCGTEGRGSSAVEDLLASKLPLFI